MPQNLKTLVTQSLYPKITNVTTGSATAVVPAGGETVTITGSGFLANAVVWVNNANVSTTFVNSTSLTFTSTAQSAGFYQLSIVNTDGTVATRPGGLIYNAAPVWTTSAGALAPAAISTAYSTTIVATGGTITYSVTSGSLPNGLTLNSSTGVISGTATVENTFNFTIAATNQYNQTTTRAFSIVASSGYVTEALIVAGGGGGGGAGGGAGGLLYYGSETPKTPNGDFIVLNTGVTYTITVGAGGAPGGNSSIIGTGLSLIAVGGGSDPSSRNGGSGAGAERSTQIIGLGTAGQGNNGGSANPGALASGGGGGAGTVGGNATSVGGTGGSGLTYSISGSAIGYAGGGGGGGNNGGGSASQGGGGGASGNATSGTANTGGGGGGIYTNGPGTGGSGIVIVRYPSTYSAAASTTGSPTVTVTGGYRIYRFTGSGSITI